MDLLLHGLVDGGALLLDGFEIEPGGNRLLPPQPEDDDPAHPVRCAVEPGPGHLPLGPHLVAADDLTEDLGADIRGACGVSVESVYKRFPGKTALVRAVVEQALRGIGPVAAESRSDALEAEDLASLLDGWGRLTAEVGPRVAPILLLLDAAAAHDPELEELARGLADDRRARMTENALRLADAGHLPPELPVARATDILLTYSSPQLYDLLVLRSGWDLDRYASFVTTGIRAQLAA